MTRACSAADEVPSPSLPRGRDYIAAMFSSTITPLASPAERRSAILDALSRSGDVTHFVPCGDGYLEVPVVALPHPLLAYRADNGRVLSELADAASRDGMDVGALKEQAETPRLQNLLHALLLDKARDPGGPIYDELQRFGQQTEPLLVRRDGVVLNGNRRLAAMRHLLRRDRERFAQFETVSAAVLPEGLQQDELEFIEAALQMAPDLKLEYGWINRRLKLRQHVGDMDRERVHEAWRFPRASDVDDQLGQLELAEAYLDWSGHPRAFAFLEECEALFVDLHAQLGKLQAPFLKETWKLLGFAMLKAAPELDAKISHYFPFADPLPSGIQHWVPRTLAEDHGLVERQDTGENRSLDKATAARLRPLLEYARRAAGFAQAVVALSDTLKADEGKLLGVSQVLSSLRRARRVLREIDPDTLQPDQLREIRAQLAALQQHAGARDATAESVKPPAWPDRRTLSRLRGAWRAARRSIQR